MFIYYIWLGAFTYSQFSIQIFNFFLWIELLMLVKYKTKFKIQNVRYIFQFFVHNHFFKKRRNKRFFKRFWFFNVLKTGKRVASYFPAGTAGAAPGTAPGTAGLGVVGAAAGTGGLGT